MVAIAPALLARADEVIESQIEALRTDHRLANAWLPGSSITF
jgi:hypothetical protein